MFNHYMHLRPSRRLRLLRQKAVHIADRMVMSFVFTIIFTMRVTNTFISCYLTIHSGEKKVKRIRRIPYHGVAALSAFGIEEGNPFRDWIDSLLIDLEGEFLLMINKVIKRNKENTPHLKGTLTIELNQVNTCLTFQQVLYFTSL